MPRVWKELLAFFWTIALLVVAAWLLDATLHQMNAAWVGRYLGIAGTLVIALSFLYSLRKRQIITWGSPRVLLTWHEVLAWSGALMILVHGGVHFQALLPWLAVWVMMIVVISGHVGRYLLGKARAQLKRQEAELKKQGLSEEEIDRRLFYQALTIRQLSNWRAIHIPFVVLFVILAVIHIGVIVLFWGWR